MDYETLYIQLVSYAKMQNIYTYILTKRKFAFHSSANMYSRLLTIYEVYKDNRKPTFW